MRSVSHLNMHQAKGALDLESAHVPRLWAKPRAQRMREVNWEAA